VNLLPWQADSEFPTAPPPETAFTQRLSDDDDTATHVSESADPAAASLGFTPGGQWWNELAQLHPFGTGLLPAGYSPSSCESSPAPKDAVAEMVCARNADPGGPAAASYTLVPEHRAVNTTLDEHLRGSTVVTCPGNIQSPGP
jgi:hypothetical protein